MARKIKSPAQSFGSILIVLEIIIWSIFPAAVSITQYIMFGLEPNLLPYVLNQLFLQWLGGSIILGLVAVFAVKRGKLARLEKSPISILVIETMILFVLLAVSWILIL
ncbi:MAG: hypothetical protein RTS72_02995 [Candidatus Thorarchaeota archaeon]